MLGVNTQYAIILLECAHRVAASGEKHAQIVACLEVVRCRFQRAVKIGFRFIQSAERGKHGGPGATRLAGVAGEHHGVAE